MATEDIMMQAVKKGGDRQELHERLRAHSIAAARVIKEEGGENDLLSRIAADPAFGLGAEELAGIMRPERYTGRSAEQTCEFLDEYIEPVLRANQNILGMRGKLRV
jgi:adenylosuccinate lyase